jgi:hypothetical protein
VLYTTINTLEDDILLGIFNNYRLANENDLDFRFEWRKLSHVCRRWRHLIHASAIHLAMHIRCRNGTPILDTLGYLPPLPLFVDYLDQTGRDLGWVIRMGALSLVVSEEDELGVYGALRLHERVRRIDLHLLPSTLHKCFMLMDKPFPILERLSLSTITDKIIPIPTVPMTFLAPNLHHLSLLGIRLPRRLRLLSSTVSLVTLELKGIQASGYFRPRLLVARLHSLHKLEELSIGFSIPITRPSAERLLIGKQGPAVFLSNLRRLSFRGVSAYIERLVSQIRPLSYSNSTSHSSIKSPSPYHICPTSSIPQTRSSSPLQWFHLATKLPLLLFTVIRDGTSPTTRMCGSPYV